MSLTHALASLVPLLLAVTTGTWPIGPGHQVVRPFAPPETQWGAGHRGVDLLGAVGQPVRAARAGTVRFAGSLAGRGVVVLDHGTTRTTYEPVAASVRVGETVTAGDRIGTLQAVPGHCWPAVCLHWGLIRGDTYLDPLSLVGATPVRLLPLAQAPASGEIDPEDEQRTDTDRDELGAVAPWPSWFREVRAPLGQWLGGQRQRLGSDPVRAGPG